MTHPPCFPKCIIVLPLYQHHNGSFFFVQVHFLSRLMMLLLLIMMLSNHFPIYITPIISGKDKETPIGTAFH